MRRGRRSTTWSSSRSTDRRSGRGARLLSVCQRPEQPQRRGGDRRVSFAKSPPDHGSSSSARARRGPTRIAPTFRDRSRTWYSDRRSATATAQRRPPRRSRRPAGVCPSPPSVATRRRCHRRTARAFRRCWPPAIARGVAEAAARAGIGKLAPHDLRRTCARLCHLAGGELDQIQFLLGHVSIQTTERYLGCKQRLRCAVNDRLGIEPDAA